MAKATITLEEFLRDLAEKRGLTGKVRLIGRYWRQIQKLSPDQRERVALALGSKAAWAQMEKLFARDGELSEEELAVKKALDRVGGADPAELRRIAELVRERDTDELKNEFLRLVGGALEEEALQQEEAELQEAFDEAVPTPAGVAAEPAAAAFEAPPVAAPVEPPVVAAAETVVRPEPRVNPERSDAKPPVERQEPEGELENSPGEPSWMQPWDERSQDDELSAVDRLNLLRDLRLDAGAATSMGPEGRAQLLEQIGSGWAGRRALTQMIRNRSLDDLDEALRLARQLESSVQQSWCLAELLEHWTLDDAGRHKVIEAAPTDAARRRLERRPARPS